MIAPSARPVRVLPDDLANKIAAGEVVERPASVIKELCENALDAGASRIDVAIEGGGVAACRVTDDGHGMAQDDVRACVTRHATSKIASLDDLARIASFGFRGEALPSIASVSRFTIASRERAADAGVALHIDGGGAPVVEPRGMAPGTRVEVRDLFFNVPARRKFLRALATESAHVSEVVDHVALCRPEITVTLERDGRRVREFLRAGSREERVGGVLVGWELARCAGRAGPLAVEGYLSRPEKARMGATGLSMFVNGRPVRDRALARAVAYAYGSVLSPGRYPVGVVYLDLDHDLVDVNVHPQKSEVRFADARAVQDAVHRVIQSGLGTAFTRQLGLAGSGPAPALYGKTAPAAPATDAPAQAVWTGTGVLGAADPPAEIRYPTHEPDAARLLSTHDAQAVPSGVRFLAQVRGTYLICESEDALLLIDQHAAAERVAFDRLKRTMRQQRVAMQALLVPELIDAQASDVTMIEELSELVASMGMDLRPAGRHALAVHAIPQILARADPRVLASDLVAELARSGGRDYSQAIDLALATMACHGSIRAGDAVDADEASQLLRALAEIEFGGHCPHGRPVLMRLPLRDLDQRVGRR